MKQGFNIKANLPTLEFDESDFTNAFHIKQMMNGKFQCEKCQHENDNFGWRTLLGYFESARLAILENGKKHARSRATKDICSNDFSILDGFDFAISVPSKAVLQTDLIRMKNKQIKEASNAGSEYDAE